MIEAAVRDDALAPSVELQLLLRQVPVGDDEVDADPLDFARTPHFPQVSGRPLDDVDLVLFRRVRRLEDHAGDQILVVLARNHFQPGFEQNGVGRRPLLLALGVRDALASVVSRRFVGRLEPVGQVLVCAFELLLVEGQQIEADEVALHRVQVA